MTFADQFRDAVPCAMGCRKENIKTVVEDAQTEDGIVGGVDLGQLEETRLA